MFRREDWKKTVFMGGLILCFTMLVCRDVWHVTEKTRLEERVSALEAEASVLGSLARMAVPPAGERCPSSVSAKVLWIIRVSNPDLSQDLQKEYLDAVMEHSSKFNLDPVLVASLIHRESNFKAGSVSRAGAKGPMQVIPKWHREKLASRGITADGLHEIQTGISVGSEVLAEYLADTNGDAVRALYKYVGGKHSGYVMDIFNMMRSAERWWSGVDLKAPCRKI